METKTLSTIISGLVVFLIAGYMITNIITGTGVGDVLIQTIVPIGCLLWLLGVILVDKMGLIRGTLNPLKGARQSRAKSRIELVNV